LPCKISLLYFLDFISRHYAGSPVQSDRYWQIKYNICNIKRSVSSAFALINSSQSTEILGDTHPPGAATGYQPIEYVQGLRIEAAKQLLETETTAIEEISNTVGYEDPTSFRRLFKRNTGITPAIYRKKFCSIAGLAIHLDS
jgi:AraC-like DNA-binding protein